MSSLDSSLGPSVATGCSPSWDNIGAAKSQAASMRADLKRRLSDNKSIFIGSYTPALVPNPKCIHNWLPNEQFGSAHISLCADVYLDTEWLSVEWDH